MDSYVQPAALRAASIDLSPYLPSLDKPKPKLPALIVLDGSEGLRKDGKTQTSKSVALAMSIRQMLGMVDKPLMALNPDGMFGYHWPKGIPWTAFPILSDARYRPYGVRGYAIWEPGSSKPTVQQDLTVETCLAAAETVVITDGCDFHLHRCRIFLRQHPNLDRIAVFRQMQNGALERLDQDQIDGLGARAAISERFTYSYKINIRAIARKVLLPTFDGFLVDYNALTRNGILVSDRFRENFQKKILAEDKLWGELEYVEALQVLYLLRKKGGIAWHMPENTWKDDLHERRGLALRDLFHAHNSADDRAILWPGTGKYDPVQFNLRWLDWIMSHQLRDGLIEFSPCGERLRLSPVGARFLDKLPKDCEDPDVLGRWQGLDAATAGPSMDAWLLRFFRKMKVAANKS